MPATRPSLALLGAEPFRAALEFASNRLCMAGVTRAGDGHPVVIFPGLGANGLSVSILRDYCRSLGYDAFDWGQGFNTGPKGHLDEWLSDLRHSISKLLDAKGPQASLIGWSLGGLYAREVAKLMPRQVRQVITIGTPFNAGPDHTHAGWLYGVLNGGPAKIDTALARRLRTPPPLPTTSIYSRSDGVVSWRACRHARRMPQVHDIEVDSSHIGMGWNRGVLETVKDKLGAAAPVPLPA